MNIPTLRQACYKTYVQCTWRHWYIHSTLFQEFRNRTSTSPDFCGRSQTRQWTIPASDRNKFRLRTIRKWPSETRRTRSVHWVPSPRPGFPSSTSPWRSSWRGYISLSRSLCYIYFSQSLLEIPLISLNLRNARAVNCTIENWSLNTSTRGGRDCSQKERIAVHGCTLDHRVPPLFTNGSFIAVASFTGEQVRHSMGYHPFNCLTL